MAIKTSRKREREEKVLMALRRFSDDIDWISESQETLRKKFANKYIAVIDGKVINSSVELETLLQKLKEEGRNPSEIPIEFISRKPQRLILSRFDSAMEIRSCAF